jgi:hypothetical protein
MDPSLVEAESTDLFSAISIICTCSEVTPFGQTFLCFVFPVSCTQVFPAQNDFKQLEMRRGTLSLAFHVVLLVAIIAPAAATIISSSRIVKCVVDGGSNVNSTQTNCGRKLVVTMAVSSSAVRVSIKFFSKCQKCPGFPFAALLWSSLCCCYMII